MMIEYLNIELKYNLLKLESFISNQNLYFDENIDLALVIKENNEIVACACKKDNIFKMIAVADNYQSNNYVSTLISELINKGYQEGYNQFFIYTKLIYEDIFSSFGFKKIVSYQEIGFFEKAVVSFDEYYLKYQNNYHNKGCIVMNANPFTLGHYYLVKKALEKVDYLYVFVVEEDKSYFDFKTRFNLVKKALSNLENVKVIPSGPYIISQATFPTYFLKSLDKASEYYANIDSLLFIKIMNLLNINYRFVGSEPLDKLTNYYNQVLHHNLKDKLIIIDRKSINNNIVSASLIRKLLLNKKYDDIKELVKEELYHDIITYVKEHDRE
ncbi:MAG: adenylyltransferase/cytidyltransferase family protein [Bacilli bacterium]|jgi:[citrate (pro-3S)-lyase] ligase|nr:adenylyltransferase/cytidyltransferase family protein [Bacilli bacterium]